jgi:hypothetical protein
MPDDKKKKGFFQKLADLAGEFVEWLADTFGDPELAAELKSDIGLDPGNPATPAQPSPATMQRLAAFAKKTDAEIDKAALMAVAADLKAVVTTLMEFIEAARADGVDARVLFTTVTRMFLLDMLRVRNPSAYDFVKIVGLLADDDENLAMLDASRFTTALRGEGTPSDTAKWIQRLSGVLGLAAVIATEKVKPIGGVIDAVYGWEPVPGEDVESVIVASRALTLVLDADVLAGVRPALTMIAVPDEHGPGGFFVSLTSGFSFPIDAGDVTYAFEVTGAGQFGLLITGDGVETTGQSRPSVRVTAAPRAGLDLDANPAIVVGPADGSRLQVGALSYGIELTGDSAAFRAGLRKARLVISLGDGDPFLRQLGSGAIDIPFEVGLIGDTGSGLRFDGGSGVKTTLPVAANVLGVFTVHFLELELVFEPTTRLRLVGGFGVKIGPFAASVDRVGVSLDLTAFGDDPSGVTDLLAFEPPKGLGLVIDAGAVKGGGYLFIDGERGEYAGALELKFLMFSIKAIGLLSTKRPDGSEGWSLLLFVFGQFDIHIAFGIFWTGLGGMIGLHHRADVDALTAGMKTGALDDILFPDDPVRDAPRIISRYRTLFPIEPDNLLLGPMLEFAFSQPPIVYIRLGLIFDVRNALGGGSTELARVILVGQMLVQLPPKDTGVPAILKMLVDVVGFYDADTAFLLIRARLRDSFVGIEGFAKLDLAGEYLFAAQFGTEAGFVISAGGFHPKYQDLPERVPRDLDRLKVSFGVSVIKLSVEQYFAVTPNSVQAGQKAILKADLGVGVEASLSWDALLYLSPRFCFIVDVEFKAKITAFGETLMAVRVTATIEGPDRWHVFGEFSFSILWWDKSISFDETWGAIETADSGTTTILEALGSELSDPDNITVEAPVGGSSLVTLAPSGTLKLGHPLGRLAIRQRAIPFDLVIDRVGTKSIASPQSVTVETVRVNDEVRTEFESTTLQFARGHFMGLTDEEKLTGAAVEDFRNGVVVGALAEVADDARARDVKVSFETISLDPRPGGIIDRWRSIRQDPWIIPYVQAVESSRIGAAARSERAAQALRSVTTIAASVVAPAMTLVTPGTMAEAASLAGPAAASRSVALQTAAASALHLVEAFEVVP